MTERIVGPISGYFIASYACAMGELGREFLGFAKLCITRPQDFFEAKGFAEFTTSDLLDTAEAALERVEWRAKQRISQLTQTP